MRKTFEVEVSSVLFPTSTIEYFCQAEANRFGIQVVSASEERLVLRAESLEIPDLGRAKRSFSHRLTEALFDRLADARAEQKLSPNVCLPKRRIDATFRLLEEWGSSPVLIVMASSWVHSPRRLLEVVASLRDRAWISLETLNPVDRTVVVIQLDDSQIAIEFVDRILRALRNRS